MKDETRKKTGLMFWGYLHTNGTIQCKRWFGDIADFTTDCEGNPFVKKVVEPFAAISFQDAQQRIKNTLQNG